MEWFTLYLMKKLTKIGETTEQEHLKTALNQAKRNIKKGIQIGVLGTALTTMTGCQPGSWTYYNGEQIEKPSKTPGEPYEPYDIAMGNGHYVFHNFMGEEPDIIEQTVTTDVEHYLSAGQTYLQNLFSDFNDSLTDRPALQRYFRRFNYQASNKDRRGHHDKNNGGTAIDTTINQISDACEPIMADIVKNLDNATDRDGISICYRILGNEAYKEGLGIYRNEKNDFMHKYNQERSSLKTAMSANYDLNFNLDNEIDILYCRRTTDHLDQLLDRAAQNMNGKLNGELKVADLQQIINIALTTRSLEAMHDFTQENLRHQNCQMELGITDAMYTADAEKQAEYQASLGR